MNIQEKLLIKIDDSDIKSGRLVIPEGVTTIGQLAAVGRQSLKSITIPESVTAIESAAFRRCTSLESIVIPQGVKTIWDFVFDGCTSLKSIVIPNSVTSIGMYAFQNCTSLTSIVIPTSVKIIDSSAFENCTSLSIIHIDADTQEEYERILKLLPPALQKTIQANTQAVLERAEPFIEKADKGFIPRDVTIKIVADLAEQYKIPSFMITKKFEALNPPKETTKMIKEQLNEIKAEDSAEANDENRNDDGGMRNS